MEAHIGAALAGWSLAPVVRALRTLRGLALVDGTVVAELGDIFRFESPRQLMACTHGPRLAHVDKAIDN